jgi:hypothetical protein
MAANTLAITAKQSIPKTDARGILPLFTISPHAISISENIEDPIAAYNTPPSPLYLDVSIPEIAPEISRVARDAIPIREPGSFVLFIMRAARNDTEKNEIAENMIPMIRVSFP